MVWFPGMDKSDRISWWRLWHLKVCFDNNDDTEEQCSEGWSDYERNFDLQVLWNVWDNGLSFRGQNCVRDKWIVRRYNVSSCTALSVNDFFREEIDMWAWNVELSGHSLILVTSHSEHKDGSSKHTACDDLKCFRKCHQHRNSLSVTEENFLHQLQFQTLDDNHIGRNM